MPNIRVEGHLHDDHSVMVCSGDSPDDVSWARDQDTGHVFVVLERIAPEDVRGEREDNRRCFGLRLYGGAVALPQVGRILEVA
jgi:hypothetical protein